MLLLLAALQSTPIFLILLRRDNCNELRAVTNSTCGFSTIEYPKVVSSLRTSGNITAGKVLPLLVAAVKNTFSFFNSA